MLYTLTLTLTLTETASNVGESGRETASNVTPQGRLKSKKTKSFDGFFRKKWGRHYLTKKYFIQTLIG